MGFHRFAVPSYTGGLPGGYDYLNNAVSGTPAAAAGALGAGTNTGSYFFGTNEQATSAAWNRAAKALGENTDALDDLLRRDVAIPTVSGDTVAGAPVTSIVLTGPGIFIGEAGTPNTLAGIRTFVRVVDENDTEIFTAAGIECAVTSITGGTPGAGFSSGNITLNFVQAIPISKTYRVYYSTRSNLATMNSGVLARHRRQNVSPTYSGPAAIGPYSLLVGTTQAQVLRLLDILNGQDATRAATSATTIHTNSPGAVLRDGQVILNPAASFNLQLPGPAVGKGMKVLLVNGDGSMSLAKKVTLVRAGAEKINNVAANYDLSVPSGAWWLTGDGTNWFVCALNARSSPTIQGLRLSPRTGEPIPLADTAAATTLYFTPYRSGSIALFDGFSWVERITPEISLALTGLAANTNYDIFAYWDAATSAVKLDVAGWSGPTTRTTALVRQDGVWVLTGLLNYRYVGTIRTTASVGTTTDSLTQRYIWNIDNQERRILRVTDATANWTQTTNTFRQARAASTNQVEVVVGLPAQASARVSVMAGATTNPSHARVGVGVDSITVDSAFAGGTLIPVGGFEQRDCLWEGLLTTGYHFLAWLEQGENATVTWLGDGSTSARSARMQAAVQG